MFALVCGEREDEASRRRSVAQGRCSRLGQFLPWSQGGGRGRCTGHRHSYPLVAGHRTHTQLIPAAVPLLLPAATACPCLSQQPWQPQLAAAAWARTAPATAAAAAALAALHMGHMGHMGHTSMHPHPSLTSACRSAGRPCGCTCVEGGREGGGVWIMADGDSKVCGKAPPMRGVCTMGLLRCACLVGHACNGAREATAWGALLPTPPTHYHQRIRNARSPPACMHPPRVPLHAR